MSTRRRVTAPTQASQPRNHDGETKGCRRFESVCVRQFQAEMLLIECSMIEWLSLSFAQQRGGREIWRKVIGIGRGA